MGHVEPEFDLVGHDLDLPKKLHFLVHKCLNWPGFVDLYVVNMTIFVGGQGHVPQGQIRVPSDLWVIGRHHTGYWVR